jgi:hypothetical protein
MRSSAFSLLAALAASMSMVSGAIAQIDDRVVGAWAHEDTGVRLRIESNWDVTFSSLKPGRVASTTEEGANTVLSGPGYNCYYYVNQIARDRMSWELYRRISSPVCPRGGVFSRREIRGETSSDVGGTSGSSGNVGVASGQTSTSDEYSCLSNGWCWVTDWQNRGRYVPKPKPGQPPCASHYGGETWCLINRQWTMVRARQ